MLERLIDHINRHPGVSWVTFEEITDDFRERQPMGEPAQVEGLETP
jgi:peptidoglycan-N-acetylglucosamine deacetylase